MCSTGDMDGGMRSKNPVTQLQCVRHVYEESMADSSRRGFFRPGCDRSRCSLCQDVLKPSHTHPKQWNPDVLELLKQFCPGIPPSACVCKADEMSLRRKVNGMVKGEFIPRWVKRERTKTVPQCCVPGCSAVSERACSFASFDTICAAVDVACGSTGESGPSSYTLCSQHFHIVYKFCNPEHVGCMCTLWF